MNMKIWILCVAILLFACDAFAESTNAISTGATQLRACANAKQQAAMQCETRKAKSFGNCDCAEGDFEGGDKHQCSVDAICTEEKADDANGAAST